MTYMKAAYLEHNVTQILFVSIQWLQQLQRLSVQQEYRIALRKHQLQSNFRIWITVDGQFSWCGALANICNETKEHHQHKL